MDIVDTFALPSSPLICLIIVVLLLIMLWTFLTAAKSLVQMAKSMQDDEGRLGAIELLIVGVMSLMLSAVIFCTFWALFCVIGPCA